MTKYADIVADLEYKVAAGIATPTELNMASAIGIEPPRPARKGYTQMSYKNGNGNGSTGAASKNITSAQASDDQAMDPDRAQALAGALKSLGLDTAGLERRLSSGMPQTQIDELVRLLNSFLWPAPGEKTVAPLPARQGSQGTGTGVQTMNNKTMGVNGGPGANPRPSQATQKAYANRSTDPYANLTRGFFKAPAS